MTSAEHSPASTLSNTIGFTRLNEASSHIIAPPSPLKLRKIRIALAVTAFSGVLIQPPTFVHTSATAGTV